MDLFVDGFGEMCGGSMMGKCMMNGEFACNLIVSYFLFISLTFKWRFFLLGGIKSVFSVPLHTIRGGF